MGITAHVLIEEEADYKGTRSCGNSSIDDPDGIVVFEEAMAHIKKKYPLLQRDISMMSLGPNDQLLNMLISNAHVVLQLSTMEGFEIKVSEALHAGRPVIGTFVGGLPLQINNRVNGYLVSPGDWKAVAGHLMELFTDDQLYHRLSAAAKTGLSDEVGTIGNALAWYFLASKFAIDGGLTGNGRWVNDMARDERGADYTEFENRLPRFLSAEAEHGSQITE